MRIQFITDRLAIGGAINGVNDFETVRQKGITHIIDLDQICDIHAASTKYHQEDEVVEVLHYYLPDNKLPKPFRYFVLPVLFGIEALFENEENKVFIHCKAGINRSVSIAYALLRCLGMKEIDVERLIFSRYFKPLMEIDSNLRLLHFAMPGEKNSPGLRPIVQYKDEVEKWMPCLKNLISVYKKRLRKVKNLVS